MAAAAIGLLVYIGAALFADPAKLKQALLHLGWLGAGEVLALSVLNYWLRFQRWRLYMSRLGHRLPAVPHLLAYLSGFALTVSPAKAGEAVRSLYLCEHGVAHAETIAAVFVERLLDLLAVALLAGLIVFEQRIYWPVLIGVGGVAAAVLLIAAHPALPNFLQRLAQRRQGLGHHAFGVAARLLQTSRRLMQPQMLLPGLVIGLLAWAAEGIGFHLICNSLGCSLGLIVDAGIYGLAVAAGCAAFFMPGGIGGMEVAMTGLLAGHGTPLPVALIATLLCRLATLWFAVLIGLASTAILESSPGLRPARSLP